VALERQALCQCHCCRSLADAPLKIRNGDAYGLSAFRPQVLRTVLSDPRQDLSKTKLSAIAACVYCPDGQVSLPNPVNDLIAFYFAKVSKLSCVIGWRCFAILWSQKSSTDFGHHVACAISLFHDVGERLWF